MKVRFLGGCREVGRSAIAVELHGKYILLDYGVMLNHDIGFPMHIPPKDLKAIVLTHAHLDHSGATPIFFIRGKNPVYGVEPTFKLVNLLIKDFLHLSGYYLPYEYLDLQTMNDHYVNVKYEEEFNIGDAKVTLFNAGHIPGSCQVLMEHEGKRILYTGDYNKVPTRLLEGANDDYGDLDAIIIEGTYADEDHPNRLKLEEEFVSRVTEVIDRGGTVLVPSFAVGRAQEILCILEAHHFQYPIFMDGMALNVNEILIDHKESLREPDLFMRAVRNAEWIERRRDRKRAVKTPSVIISPAGMLKGGAAVFYMESIANKKENAVFLVSFQIPGTPGRILLERGEFLVHGKARRVEAEVDRFDFSSHSGRQELQDTLSKLDKATKVFIVHGAEGNCAKLAEWASKEQGLKAEAPKPGEIYEI
jgi:putative mRNA 3-end processing factor